MAFIDLQKAKIKLRYIFKKYGLSDVIRNNIINALSDSAADVVEVKHGEWIKPQFVGRRGFYGVKDYICGICKKEYAIEQPCNLMNYCPNCGAKMDGGGKNDL